MKDTCGSGKERTGREDEGEKNNGQSCGRRAQETLHFLPLTDKKIKKDEKQNLFSIIRSVYNYRRYQRISTQ